MNSTTSGKLVRWLCSRLITEMSTMFQGKDFTTSHSAEISSQQKLLIFYLCFNFKWNNAKVQLNLHCNTFGDIFVQGQLNWIIGTSFSFSI
jgi:hypothetical protein